MLNPRIRLAFTLGLVGALIPAMRGQAPVARQSGTVKAMDSTTITVVSATGTATVVPIASDAVIEQLAPGITDLKTAQPVKLSDIAVGDKVITGKAGDTATASRVIVIKSSDISARNQAEQADWQKRGSSGLVKSVEGASFIVTSGAKTVKVETTPKTVFRRYAGDSVKFQDATPGELAQIHAGDQLSVRGDKSPDGTSITAEEVVTGTFANLSGLLSSTDPAANTVTLKDLTTKKSVVVKVTPNSDVRKLPAQMAAAFSGGGARPGGAPGAGATPADGAAPADRPRNPDGARGQTGSGGPGGPGGAGGTRRAGMDLSRMLSRLPTETVADLHANDAVMIVASPSAAPGTYTAITLLSGVETLLTAPAGAQPITLSPWSLPGGGGGGGGPE